MPGQYRLRVEGNTDRALGGTAFLNGTILTFSQRSMTIFIQTEKPVYHQGQIGKQEMSADSATISALTHNERHLTWKNKT